MPISLPTTAGVYSHILFLTVYADDDASSVLRGIGLNVLGDGTLQFLDDISANTAENTMNNFGMFSAPPQTWTHVVLSLTTNSAGTTSYQAAVGSVTGMGSLMLPLQAMSRVTLGVGPAYYAGSTTSYTPSWIFDYDNVVCY